MKKTYVAVKKQELSIDVIKFAQHIMDYTADYCINEDGDEMLEGMTEKDRITIYKDILKLACEWLSTKETFKEIYI